MNWISVEDRLPEFGQKVIIKLDYYSLDNKVLEESVAYAIYRETIPGKMDFWSLRKDIRYSVEYWIPVPETQEDLKLEWREFCPRCRNQTISCSCMLNDEEEKTTDNSKKKMEWISIKERLPERDAEVLVFSTINGITIDFITSPRSDGTIMFLNEGPHVTHWMELPENPS